MLEWLNDMQGWTEARLRAVLEDDSAPVAKKRAAERWLSKDGRDFDRIMDRTRGLPKQAVEVSGTDGGPIKSESELKVAVDFERYAREFDDFAVKQLGERTLSPDRN